MNDFFWHIEQVQEKKTWKRTTRKYISQIHYFCWKRSRKVVSYPSLYPCFIFELYVLTQSSTIILLYDIFIHSTVYVKLFKNVNVFSSCHNYRIRWFLQLELSGFVCSLKFFPLKHFWIQLKSSLFHLCTKLTIVVIWQRNGRDILILKWP